MSLSESANAESTILLEGTTEQIYGTALFPGKSWLTSAWF